ncbi:MAG: ComEC/Rec2 family competence protein [Candidatus Saccharibacteria bacterium]
MPFSRPVQICLIAATALVGIIIGNLAWTISLAVYSGCLLLLALSLRKRYFIIFVLVAFFFGMWRGQVNHANQLKLAGLIGQKVIITAIISDDPSTNDKGIMSFGLDHIRSNGKSIPGSLQVYTYPLRVHRGFQLHLTGKVKSGYGKYIAELVYPKTTIISSQQSELEITRQRFFAGMKTALSEPAASFGLGLLVGIRALIPKPLQAELALVGLSHLVAVSGYNLTIIVRATERLFLRFGRGIALIISLWFIAGFLAVTGASASIVRAAMVSIMMLLATYYGRQFKPLVLILIAAASTSLAKPDYLTDLGWLLSFLAFFGILVLAPAIWRRFGEPKSILIKLLIESLCAQILTLPLILFIFGQLSIVAPLTNLLILPLVPIAMLVCFVAGLAGMLIPAWCGWLAWPAQIMLNFILKVIDSFASLPWAGSILYFDLQTMLASYFTIILVSIALNRSTPKKRSGAEDGLTRMSITGQLT